MEFRNLKEMTIALSDEKVARQHMEQMRWGGNPVCPHCGAAKPYKLKDGKTYRCKDKTCKRDFTVTVGTVFENSKVKISTWMCAVYVITAHKKGISSHQLARDLGVTQKTAWFILHRVRLILGDDAPPMLEEIVEVDETYVGGKFANMSRGRRKKFQELSIDNKTAVMGLVERGGKARLTVIGGDTFKEVVRKNVDDAAVIVTDTHLAYQGLKDEFTAHLTVNHSEMQYRQGIAYTNTVEGLFSHFKRSIIGIYHHVSPKHLEKYCVETAYRYNTRKITDCDRFKLTLSKPNGRLTYKKLTGK